MFKHEDCPGHNKLSRLIKYREEKLNRNYSIFVGNGGLYVPQELRRGADGIMTGFAFIEMLVNVFDLFNNNSKENSEDLFDLYLPLISFSGSYFSLSLSLLVVSLFSPLSLSFSFSLSLSVAPFFLCFSVFPFLSLSLSLFISFSFLHDILLTF